MLRQTQLSKKKPQLRPGFPVLHILAATFYRLLTVAGCMAVASSRLASNLGKSSCLSLLYGGQRTTCRNQFFPSTFWVPGTELRLTGLAEDTLTL